MNITRPLPAVVAVSLAIIGWQYFNRPAPVQLPPPQLSAEKAGELVTLRLHYANILEFFQKRTQDIPLTPYELRLGGTKVLMVVRGDCEISTNLQAARYEQVQQQTKSLRVVLPVPRLLQPRVSHAAREAGGSYFYTQTEEGLQYLIPSSAHQIAATNNGWAAAEKDISRYCSSPQWIAEAKKNAEQVLTPMFHASGWTATFVWQ
ncbi:DUF4230 domain-containing protein [Roseateles toxinivorans]|uniref:Uncharacterized protein DUF4230 n=1 Tax=Roseateles toxinivorans TaxID=270368 RepID=A0A4R6QTP1_9BURK|nr:DUF4230 domain-containing protein [Roseateles toxinivorans]TDP74082.1 uncharacterized protein DUF4230 [Roseateles toxinivorans]